MVKVDTDDAVAFGARAIEELKTLPRRMAGIVKMAAAIEVSTKTYTDRTKNARQSTKGYIDRTSAGETVAILEAGAEYASYLAARGFSHIDEVGRAAELQIADSIEDMGATATRG